MDSLRQWKKEQVDPLLDEIKAAWMQVSRFGSACMTWVPTYDTQWSQGAAASLCTTPGTEKGATRASGKDGGFPLVRLRSAACEE